MFPSCCASTQPFKLILQPSAHLFLLGVFFSVFELCESFIYSISSGIQNLNDQVSSECSVFLHRSLFNYLFGMYLVTIPKKFGSL